MKTTAAGMLAALLISSGAARAAEMTYAENVKPVLDAHCVECHHHRSQTVDLSVFPFKSKAGNDQDAIVAQILSLVQGPTIKMPPGNRTHLDPDQVALIKAWKDQGLKP